MRRATLAIGALLLALARARAQSTVVKITAPEEVRFSVVSREAQKISAALRNNRVGIWTLPDGKPLHELDFEKERPVQLLFAAGDKHLLVALQDGTIQVRDVESGALLRTMEAGSAQFTLALSRDARLLATTGDGGQISLWDYNTGKRLRQFAPEFGESEDLAFSPNGTVLASSGDDTNIYIWDTASGQLKHAVRDLLLTTFALAFTPDGRLVAGGADRSIHLVDVNSGKIERSLPPDKHLIAAVQVSPDGKSVAAVYRNADDPSRPAPLLVWDLRSSEIGKRIYFPEVRPNGGSYASGGRLVYSTAKGRELAVWSLP